MKKIKSAIFKRKFNQLNEEKTASVKSRSTAKSQITKNYWSLKKNLSFDVSKLKVRRRQKSKESSRKSQVRFIGKQN